MARHFHSPEYQNLLLVMEMARVAVRVTGRRVAAAGLFILGWVVRGADHGAASDLSHPKGKTSPNEE
jgi:hypothetical protein